MDICEASSLMNYPSSYSMMKDIRKLDDAGQLKVCKKFHMLICDKSLEGDFFDRYEETYSLLDEDDWELTSDYLHYVINDMDNALFYICYNNFLLFENISEALAPTIEECI